VTKFLHLNALTFNMQYMYIHTYIHIYIYIYFFSAMWNKWQYNQGVTIEIFIACSEMYIEFERNIYDLGYDLLRASYQVQGVDLNKNIVSFAP
jgi:hypothetical protein